MGPLEYTGNGARLSPEAKLTVEELEARGPELNCSLLERLRADKQASQLLQACHDDAAKGRMTKPRLVALEDLAEGNFSPRFSVEQSKVV